MTELLVLRVKYMVSYFINAIIIFLNRLKFRRGEKIHFGILLPTNDCSLLLCTLPEICEQFYSNISIKKKKKTKKKEKKEKR